MLKSSGREISGTPHKQYHRKGGRRDFGMAGTGAIRPNHRHGGRPRSASDSRRSGRGFPASGVPPGRRRRARIRTPPRIDPARRSSLSYDPLRNGARAWRRIRAGRHSSPPQTGCRRRRGTGFSRSARGRSRSRRRRPGGRL